MSPAWVAYRSPLPPSSVLWSHLPRSSSVTRSTAMKRTCRKSSQPSKVSQGCLPNCLRKIWLFPQPMAHRTPRLHRTGLQLRFTQNAPLPIRPCLLPPPLWTPDCRPDLALPSVPCCSVWLRLAPVLPVQALCTLRAPAHNLLFVSSPCVSPSLAEPLRSPSGE